MRVFYGWVIVGVVFTAWAISTGPRQAFSIFLLSFTEEFGWSRGLASGAYSAHMAFYALGGWGLGILLDRIGARRVIAIGTAGWALTLLLCSQIQSVWQLYALFGLLGGITTGGLAYVPNNAMLSRWFVRYRGLAAGLSHSGVPLGGAVFMPIAQLAIGMVGWRKTYLLFGLFVAVTAVPLVLIFLRDDPREMNLYPDGITPTGLPAGGSATHRSHSEAFSGPGVPPGYWTIFGANILRGMTVNGLLVHQVAYMVDVGHTKIAAASFASASSLMAVLGGFMTGAVSDRLGRPRTYAGTCGLFVIGILLLLSVQRPSQAGLVFLFVLASGLATGGIGPVFAALLTDRLHGPRIGSLIGLQNIAFGTGATIGPLLAGLLFDAFGGYAAAFLVLAGAALASAVVITVTPARLPASLPR